MCPGHPDVKRVMQEEIRKDWADHAPLRDTTRTLNDFSVLFHRRGQPSFDVEQSPVAFNVLSDRLQQEIMRKIVKQAFDVEFQNPIVLPAPLTRHPTASRADFPGLYP